MGNAFRRAGGGTASEPGQQSTAGALDHASGIGNTLMNGPVCQPGKRPPRGEPVPRAVVVFPAAAASM